MRFAWFLMLLVVVVVGCKQPIRIKTDSRITVAPSGHNLEPLVPMRVTGGAGGRKIALIDIDGLLLNQDMTGLYSDGENPVAVFREKLDTVGRDGCYAAVVLRINSPGGGVTASDVMWHDLASFKARTRLPVVASVMDVGAGGAYYLAMAADHVVAHPTAIVGGIGVILNLYNLEDALAQFNIVGVPIKAGEHVDLGTPIAPQSEEARKILQRMADEYHARFRDAVTTARPQLQQAPGEVFDGRIFTARQALELRLVDAIGYLDDAAQIAAQMGGAPGAPLIVLHRCHDRARTPYDQTPNVPQQGNIIPLSMPGFERSRLPTFLYLWQPDPTLERISNR